MSTVVHARLDDETRKVLEQLRRRMGIKDSEIIRRAIRALSNSPVVSSTKRIIGLGEFESGVRDLGSNKAHLGGFGSS